MRWRSIASALALIVAVEATYACARIAPPGASTPRWVGTWLASPQLTEARYQPPAPGLSGSTLRQQVHLSIGGRQVRVRFSNTFGGSPITIASAHIARSLGGGAIDPTSDRSLTFGGSAAVVIGAGEMAASDPLAYDVEPLADLAVSIHVSTAPAEVTGHPGSRTTSFLKAGDWVAASELRDAVTVERWYVLTGIDVLTDAAAAALVVIGNSITDGRGSGTDENNRWPDNLARRLQNDVRTRHIAVLNAGIGGNAVLRGGLGPTALSRLERDVFAQTGAAWLIVFEGVNDIGTATGVADELVAAYRDIISQAHAHGLRVYGGTILPFGGSFYDNPEREAARQIVNRWIRTGGAFDAVIDFDAALRDPANPSRLLPEADSGDSLHPSEHGYRMMADVIDLELFVR